MSTSRQHSGVIVVHQQHPEQGAQPRACCSRQSGPVLTQPSGGGACRYELGRQPASTKLSSHVAVRTVRVRGGNRKFRALRLDHGNYSWGSEVGAATGTLGRTGQHRHSSRCTCAGKDMQQLCSSGSRPVRICGRQQPSAGSVEWYLFNTSNRTRHSLIEHLHVMLLSLPPGHLPQGPHPGCELQRLQQRAGEAAAAAMQQQPCSSSHSCSPQLRSGRQPMLQLPEGGKLDG